MKPKRIALFGGSFDPIHLGHLAVAREVFQQMKVDRVWFIPAWQSPNKSTDSFTSPEQRMAMVHSAIEGCVEFEVCDQELKRGGTSYSHETLEELQRLYPETEWLWILGLDTFFDFPDWKHSHRILELADLIVAPRPGYDEARIKDTLNRLGTDLSQVSQPVIPNKGMNSVKSEGLDHQIHFLAGPRVDLSSSRIRQEFGKNAVTKKMLPPSVVHYIMDHQLYD